MLPGVLGNELAKKNGTEPDLLATTVASVGAAAAGSLIRTAHPLLGYEAMPGEG
jgi:hypothetical protein